MNKLLIVSELGNNVSYSYVINDLKKILDERYDCYYFCIRNLGNDRCRRKLGEEGYEMWKMFFINENLFFGKNGNRIIHKEHNDNCASGIIQIESIINHVKPDIVLLLGDTEIIKHLCLTINKIKNFKGKLIPYLPLDVNNASPEWFHYKKDFLLTVSKHSKTQFLNIHKNDKEDIHTGNVEEFPHLIEESRFSVLDNQEIYSLKKKLYGDKYKDYFVVGSVNCNCFRKKWDVLIDSFCFFAKKYPKSILVLKTTGNNEKDDCVYGGYNITNLILKYCNNYNIDSRRLILIDRHLSFSELNNLYNTFDVFLTTTSGEGWGLTAIEAALVKTPIIAPKCTTFPEIFGDDYGGLFPVKQFSIYIARTNCYIDIENNKVNGLFNTICIGYKSYKKENIEFTGELLNLTTEYPTLLISKNNVDINIKDIDIFKIFSSYEECLNFIDSENCPHIFQVVIEIDFNILNECLYEIDNNIFFKTHHYHKIIHLEKKIVDNSCNINNNPTCGIGSIRQISNKLSDLYLNEDKRNKYGDQVYNKVKGRYIHDRIKKRFNEIMDKWDL